MIDFDTEHRIDLAGCRAKGLLIERPKLKQKPVKLKTVTFQLYSIKPSQLLTIYLNWPCL